MQLIIRSRYLILIILIILELKLLKAFSFYSYLTLLYLYFLTYILQTDISLVDKSLILISSYSSLDTYIFLNFYIGFSYSFLSYSFLSFSSNSPRLIYSYKLSLSTISFLINSYFSQLLGLLSITNIFITSQSYL